MQEENANNYKQRLIDDEFDELLQMFGAVCVEGPKWCGKTWTSMHHAKTQILLGDSAGNFQNRQMAQINPSLTLIGEPPRLIDEW